MWFPVRLADCLIALILIVLFAGTHGFAAVLAVVLATGTLLAWDWYLRHRLVSTNQPDYEDALRRYAALATARAFFHAVAGVVGVLYLPFAALLPLLLLHCIMLCMASTAFTTLPHAAAANALLRAVPVSIALLWRGGTEHVLAATLVMLFAFYSVSAIYNQYYLFATRRLRTRTMQEANETVRLLFDQFAEQSNDWLWQVDKEGRLVDPPARFTEALGIEPHEMSGLTLRDLLDDGQEADALYQRGRKLEEFRDRHVPVTVNGKKRWWSVSGRPQFDRDGAFTGYRGFITDISARREAEERAAFLAHYDPLTELPNRELFNQRLSRAIKRWQEGELLAVLHLDLDHFKEVNETQGHGGGDIVLREAARRIESVVGLGAMVARLASDEFAVILTELDDRAAAIQTAEQILQRMHEPISIYGENVVVGASLGLAYAPQDGESADELLRSADIALNQAKRSGRGGLSTFNEEMRDALQDRRHLEADLREALVTGGLDLYFKPLVDTASREITGYEALLRWNHPQRGPIPPESFIELAENAGLIVPLGEWVIREALAAAANWPEELSVAVNLSPTQLRSERLLPTVVGALSQSGVAASRLEIEITESVLMDHSEENLATLHKLHDLGIRIALDDFGTGYSSLNYLRSFPFDKIKIDRCSIEDLAECSGNLAIVEAVLTLAADLDMVTTAEGVENHEQLDLLTRKGCKQVQGFLFSKALPAEELSHGNAGQGKGAKTGAGPVRIARGPDAKRAETEAGHAAVEERRGAR